MSGISAGVQRHPTAARAAATRRAPHPVVVRPRTSLMRLSSSTRGFSKSSTVVLDAFSLTGPNRDRMDCSHSRPPCRTPPSRGLGTSGGSAPALPLPACATTLSRAGRRAAGRSARPLRAGRRRCCSPRLTGCARAAAAAPRHSCAMGVLLKGAAGPPAACNSSGSG